MSQFGAARKVITRGVSIRLARKGCANRPSYHILVQDTYRAPTSQFKEQVGTYDPMPNKDNEKLVSFNFERIKHWLAVGAIPTQPVCELLGLCGFFPLHPMTYIKAKRNRAAEEASREKQETVSEEDEMSKEHSQTFS